MALAVLTARSRLAGSFELRNPLARAADLRGDRAPEYDDIGVVAVEPRDAR
jgi:hypothetical protein